ncbi:MAG: hypothetical protein CMO80_02460 [Verrucomicrobiales bacterium]|nr:hypothetical protein [Verrucomicrobiales bacterium]|tara:strand:+ start:555 stop:1142 length:588 start_codon:yes stop_codon:yes gene_type:complete
MQHVEGNEEILRDMVEIFFEETGQFMDFVNEGSSRMKSLLDDPTDFARIKTRGGKFTAVNLGELLDEIEVLMADELKGTGTVIERSNLATVNGDRSQLKRLFRELIGNSIRFRSKEASKVSINCSDSGMMQSITLSDNGIGFPDEHREDIFAICRRIIERHAGSIEAKPLEDGGAEFNINLPRNADKERDAADYL